MFETEFESDVDEDEEFQVFDLDEVERQSFHRSRRAILSGSSRVVQSVDY